jgi:hypothetical protein
MIDTTASPSASMSAVSAISVREMPPGSHAVVESPISAAFVRIRPYQDSAAGLTAALEPTPEGTGVKRSSIGILAITVTQLKEEKP